MMTQFIPTVTQICAAFPWITLLHTLLLLGSCSVASQITDVWKKNSLCTERQPINYHVNNAQQTRIGHTAHINRYRRLTKHFYFHIDWPRSIIILDTRILYWCALCSVCTTNLLRFEQIVMHSSFGYSCASSTNNIREHSFSVVYYFTIKLIRENTFFCFV